MKISASLPWRVQELLRAENADIRGLLARDWIRNAYRQRLQWVIARVPPSVIYFAGIQLAYKAAFTKEGAPVHDTKLMDAIQIYGRDHGIEATPPEEAVDMVIGTALKSAHHALTTTHGLYATDQERVAAGDGDHVTLDVTEHPHFWRVDNLADLRAIEDAQRIVDMQPEAMDRIERFLRALDRRYRAYRGKARQR